MELSKKTYLKLSFVWGILIAVLCLTPSSGENIEIPVPHFDKITHFFLYFVWMFLILKQPNEVNSRKILLYGCACLFYGLIIEIIQHTFIKGRSLELFDIIANLAGISSATTVSKLFNKSQLSKNEF